MGRRMNGREKEKETRRKIEAQCKELRGRWEEEEKKGADNCRKYFNILAIIQKNLTKRWKRNRVKTKKLTKKLN